MAILHAATLTPSKPELIGAWLPTRPWAPEGDGAVEVVGAFRFDDPEGRVGIEVHLVRSAGVLLQVPLTYRDAPLEGAESHLAGNLEHSALGTRWVYDGLADPVFVRMLAAVTLTGTGQAVGLVEYHGRWVVVPPQVRLRGGGAADERAVVDGFTDAGTDGDWAILRNDRFELRVARSPEPGDRPPIGLTATWPGQDTPVVLAEIRDVGPA
jgi:hypothetical protein